MRNDNFSSTLVQRLNAGEELNISRPAKSGILGRLGIAIPKSFRLLLLDMDSVTYLPNSDPLVVEIGDDRA